MIHTCFVTSGKTGRRWLCVTEDLAKNQLDGQGESIQDGSKTNNDVRCRDMGSEESTREEVGCGGNKDVEIPLRLAM